MPEKLQKLKEQWETVRPSQDPGWFIHSTTLFQHYLGLIDQTGKIAFPEQTGRYLPLDMDGWSKPHKILYWYSNPLAWFLQFKQLRALVFLLLAYLVVPLWIIGGIFLFSLAMGDTYTLQPKGILTPIDNLISGLMIISVVILAPGAYFRLRAFITDKRYTVINKGFFSLIASAGIVGLTFWGFSYQHPLTFAQVLQSCTNAALLVCAYIFFLIPFFTFGLLLVWDSFCLIINQWISMRDYLYTLHYPLPFDLVSNILFHSFSQDDSTANWRLSELPSQELTALLKWAEANRESSEKRVTPALVFVAALGFIASIGLFNGLTTKGIGYFENWVGLLKTNSFGANLLTPNYIMESLTISFIFAFILYLTFLFSEIFRNITVQSLIIETCIVAEYAAREKEDEKKLRRSRTVAKKIILEEKGA